MHIAAANPGLAEPFHLRAWALQESCLSPRLLEYSSKQVHWTCHSAALFNGWSPFRSGYNKSFYEKQERTPQAFVRKRNAVIYWWDLIYDYTMRSITC